MDQHLLLAVATFVFAAFLAVASTPMAGAMFCVFGVIFFRVYRDERAERKAREARALAL